MRSLAEEVDADVLDGGLNGVQARCLAFGVKFGNQVINLPFMAFQPRADVGLVDVDGALFAGHDEVEVHTETHPRVERYPVEDEVQVRLDQEKHRQGGPVHEPWCKVGGVAGLNGLVGGEDGEENGGD